MNLHSMQSVKSDLTTLRMALLVVALEYLLVKDMCSLLLIIFMQLFQSLTLNHKLIKCISILKFMIKTKKNNELKLK
jgi:hypothetical protein